MFSAVSTASYTVGAWQKHAWLLEVSKLRGLSIWRKFQLHDILMRLHVESDSCDRSVHAKNRLETLANFRLLFNLLLIRSSTARGSLTSILSRWSLQKLTSWKTLRVCILLWSKNFLHTIWRTHFPYGDWKIFLSVVNACVKRLFRTLSTPLPVLLEISPPPLSPRKITFLWGEKNHLFSFSSRCKFLCVQ